MSTRPPDPSPSYGYITVHTPACPTQITRDTHLTLDTVTDEDPAPLSPSRPRSLSMPLVALSYNPHYYLHPFPTTHVSHNTHFYLNTTVLTM